MLSGGLLRGDRLGLRDRLPGLGLAESTRVSGAELGGGGAGSLDAIEDATTLEANAAMRSIVRRDSGAVYEGHVKELWENEEGEEPTAADRRRYEAAVSGGPGERFEVAADSRGGIQLGADSEAACGGGDAAAGGRGTGGVPGRAFRTVFRAPGRDGGGREAAEARWPPPGSPLRLVLPPGSGVFRRVYPRAAMPSRSSPGWEFLSQPSLKAWHGRIELYLEAAASHSGGGGEVRTGTDLGAGPDRPRPSAGPRETDRTAAGASTGKKCIGSGAGAVGRQDRLEDRFGCRDGSPGSGGSTKLFVGTKGVAAATVGCGLPERWIEALFGRTGAHDDRRVFELIRQALDASRPQLAT